MFQRGMKGEQRGLRLTFRLFKTKYRTFRTQLKFDRLFHRFAPFPPLFSYGFDPFRGCL